MNISIDGIDGTGKSTVARAVAIALKARSCKCMPRRFRALEPRVREKALLDTKFLFYLSAYHEGISKALAGPHKVIFDRYVYSTVAYHRALGSRIKSPYLLDAFPTPQIRVFLTCPVDRWQSILRKKEYCDWYERLILRNPALARAIEDQYRNLGLIEVQNNHLDETVTQIVEMAMRSK